ncbi:MAG TPA: metallo-mystery pair system four-Cys motif protein [Myxococcota bacterium]|nr:metallo-mystery pair system four-Cys motif protein [Myxococcota bacterium]
MRLAGALLLALAACTDKDKDDAPPVDSDTGPDVLDLELRFAAEIDNQPVSCHREVHYQGLLGNATVRVRGMRVFVSNVGMVDASGNTTLLELDQDDWQIDRTALLDYEDGAEYCEGGTAEMNTTVRGKVPNADYTGLAFTIGVPEDLNHSPIDAGTPAALNHPELFTGALYGYHYLKLDMTTTGEPEGYPIHVHASGCIVDEFGNPAGCSGANLVTFVLPAFDPDTQQVTLDLSDLLSRNDIDRNAASPGGQETAAGCQSDTTDPDCQTFFTSYGLSALPPTWVRAAEVLRP